MNGISIFSFFSGAGFLDLGFEESGFKICFVNELKDTFLNAYIFSHTKMGLKPPKYGYSNKSIETFLKGDNHDFLCKSIQSERASDKIIGFIGGPPCPDFSVGGKNRGKNGDNGRLSGIYIQLISDMGPDFFVFENVKGLWRTKRHRDFFEELKTVLKESGYAMTEKLVNSIEYGVPQDRDRIILFGIKSDLLKPNIKMESFIWDCHVKYRRDDIFSLPWPSTNTFQGPVLIDPIIPSELTVDHWFKKNDVENHPNSNDRFRPKAGLSKFEVIDEGDDSKKSYKRLHRHRFSPTVCYGNNEVHLHPTLPRRISVSEALSLQSLPKNYELPPNMSLTDKFKTIGNGVPFLLAQGIALTILDFLRKNMRVAHGSDCK